ncbi:MAG: hypothetical protein H6Q67_746 [Firmicutes bacterium]|nr:hypothetical protein [Bacillota bacterium]
MITGTEEWGAWLSVSSLFAMKSAMENCIAGKGLKIQPQHIEKC